jgi:ABC-type arginine transport system permease subunit
MVDNMGMIRNGKRWKRRVILPNMWWYNIEATGNMMVNHCKSTSM